MQPKQDVDEETGKTKFQWSVVWQVVTDWQLYLQAIVFMSNAVRWPFTVLDLASHLLTILLLGPQLRSEVHYAP